MAKRSVKVSPAIKEPASERHGLMPQEVHDLLRAEAAVAKAKVDKVKAWMRVRERIRRETGVYMWGELVANLDEGWVSKR